MRHISIGALAIGPISAVGSVFVRDPVCAICRKSTIRAINTIGTISGTICVTIGAVGYAVSTI